jgi:hypothetical protein
MPDDRDDPDFSEDLAAERKSFEKGDKAALLRILWLCAAHRLPLPDWAGDAIAAACFAAWDGEIESWDDVFGKPWGDGGQRRAVQTNSRGVEVWTRVRRLVDEEGAAITNDLFDRVGEEFGLSRPIISRLYYAVDKHWKVFRQIRQNP